MSQTKDRLATPKSIRQKQILDAAADRPEASMAAIASEVQSATPALVEQVLDEYGDPASVQSNGASEALDDESSNETIGDEPIDEAEPDGEDPYPDPADLSERQWETLRAIRDHPTASQRELADVLNLSGATVSNRANSIEGFDWADRQTFAEVMLDRAAAKFDASYSDADGEQSEDERVCDSDGRIGQLGRGQDNDAASPLVDLDLAHKVIHACMSADTITEDEELRIIQAILTGDGRE